MISPVYLGAQYGYGRLACSSVCFSRGQWYKCQPDKVVDPTHPVAQMEGETRSLPSQLYSPWK